MGYKASLLICCVFMLSACGGGSSSATDTPAPEIPILKILPLLDLIALMFVQPYYLKHQSLVVELAFVQLGYLTTFYLRLINLSQ